MSVDIIYKDENTQIVLDSQTLFGLSNVEAKKVVANAKSFCEQKKCEVLESTENVCRFVHNGVRTSVIVL